MQPAIARALTGRLWRMLSLSACALGLTAVFGVLVDAGWTLAQSLLGAILAAALLGLASILVQQRVAKQEAPP